MFARVTAHMMGPMEIHIILDRVEPPDGRLRVVGPGEADRSGKDTGVRFTGWLGLLRALYEVTGARGSGGTGGW